MPARRVHERCNAAATSGNGHDPRSRGTPAACRSCPVPAPRRRMCHHRPVRGRPRGSRLRAARRPVPGACPGATLRCGMVAARVGMKRGVDHMAQLFAAQPLSQLRHRLRGMHAVAGVDQRGAVIAVQQHVVRRPLATLEHMQAGIEGGRGHACAACDAESAAPRSSERGGKPGTRCARPAARHGFVPDAQTARAVYDRVVRPARTWRARLPQTAFLETNP